MSDDGGSAFPSLHSIDGNWQRVPDIQYRGMSLRDYFAAKAMCAYITQFPITTTAFSGLAGVAYMMADAMLKERAK